MKFILIAHNDGETLVNLEKVTDIYFKGYFDEAKEKVDKYRIGVGLGPDERQVINFCFDTLSEWDAARIEIMGALKGRATWSGE